MMQPPNFPIRFRRPVAALLASLVVAAAMLPAAGSAHIRGRHTHGLGSLVRCTSARQPVRATRVGRDDAARGQALAHYFAPTRQAVFFSHAGDRCVWHAGTPARG